MLHLLLLSIHCLLQADVLLGPAAVRQGSYPSAASVKQQQQQQCSGAMTEATAITGHSNQHWQQQQQQQQQRGADCFAGATASSTEHLLLQQLVQHMLQQQCLQPLQAQPHNSRSNHTSVGEGSMEEQQVSHLRQLLAKVDQDLDCVGAESTAAAGAAAAAGDAGTDIVLVSVIGMHQQKLNSLRQASGAMALVCAGLTVQQQRFTCQLCNVANSKLPAALIRQQQASLLTSRGHHNHTPASF